MYEIEVVRKVEHVSETCILLEREGKRGLASSLHTTYRKLASWLLVTSLNTVFLGDFSWLPKRLIDGIEQL